MSIAPFGGRPVRAEGGDRDGHGQVVANTAQKVFGDHEFLRRCRVKKESVSSRRVRLPFANGVVRGRG